MDREQAAHLVDNVVCDEAVQRSVLIVGHGDAQRVLCLFWGLTQKA